MMFRKIFLGAAILTLPLAGCSTSSVEQTHFQQMRGLWHAVLRPGQLPKSSAGQAGRLHLSLPSLNWQATFQPLSQNQGVVTWQAGQDASVMTRNGVVIGTRGLGDDLISSEVEDLLSALAGSGRAEGHRENHYLNGNIEKQIRIFICDYGRGAEGMTETCYADGLEIQNHYAGRSGSGFLQSRQWLSPQLGYADMNWTQ